jgi:ornithine cyclodeaminase/alanine dehydrogenase-like protein (mu-crystallin family)
MSTVRWIGAGEIAQVSIVDAMAALRDALRAGLDPAADPARVGVEAAAGQLLLMPSTGAGGLGVKLVSIAPANPARGWPRIQAVYVLFDGSTLAPLAVLDGTAITSLRTPAVSALAVSQLAAPDAGSLVVYGTGPQAVGHIAAVCAIRPIRALSVIGRDAGRTAAFLHEFGAGFGAGEVSVRAGDAGSVAGADIVVCATTARQPLFPAALVPAGCCVVAIGSHEPDWRELDAGLLGSATVVVEDVATALREAGDVALAVAERAIAPADLVTLADLVLGRVAPPPGRRGVFKSVGMAWQDLIVATEVARRCLDPG